MKKFLITSILLLNFIQASLGDDFCGTNNKVFLNGERITFKVFYSVIGIFIEAGTAQFSLNKEVLDNKTYFHAVGDGFSNPRYDWIFKVRDRYESYLDTNTLRPYKFIRNVNEGGYKKFENVTFNDQTRTATSKNGTFEVPPCVQDVISAVYYARNIDYNKYKQNDKIPFSLFIDDKVNNLFIRYVGKEEIKTKYGKFRAIILKPLLIKGDVFEGGEKMTLWVSDDQNHIPLRIESPISVGSVKVDMMGFANLRYPMTSRISFR
ncbi:MAG TPA: DUF3108 domain-containing protein [Chitinophagaceae bacterium]|nr:DUF3108 domain-containing protein [Chitinophagaceae bacterium]